MATPLATTPTSTPAPRGAQWLDVATAAQRIGLDERTVRRRCQTDWVWRGQAEQRRPAGGNLKAQWFVRDDADPLLARAVGSDAAAADLSFLTDAERTAVRFKRAVLAAWDDFLNHPAAGRLTKAEAERQFGELLAAGSLPVKLPAGTDAPPAPRTVREWARLHRADPVMGLVDGRTTRPQKPAADDPFFAFVRLKYLDSRKRSKRLCHELAATQAELSGWEPRHYKQTLRHLAALPPAAVRRRRDGTKAFDDSAAAHITRDYSGLRSNEVWCADHHQFDAFVTHEGRHVRPWVTGFMDVRSRKLVGWTVTPGSGNTDTILAALAAGVDSHHVPEEAYIDNGKDFDSAALQGCTKRQRAARRRRSGATLEVDDNAVAGVFGELGIKVTHAIAYNAKAKPIERMFGTLCGRFSKLQATYCGNTPANRPEELLAKLGRNVAPSLAEFTADFAAWLEGDYHARGHTGDAMDGRTPADVFDACLTVKRTAPPEVRRLLLWKPTRPTAVTKNGVRAGGVSYGQAEPALFAWIGRQVIVRVDPADVGRAAVCEPTGKLICFAAANRKLPFKSTPAELRAAIARNRAQQKLHRDYHESRPRLADDAADEMWRRRAAQAAAARAANPPPTPPTLVPVDSPLNGQLPAIERGLNPGPRASDACGVDGAADAPAAPLSWRDYGQRMDELERAREAELAAQPEDPFAQLGRFFYQSPEGAGE